MYRFKDATVPIPAPIITDTDCPMIYASYLPRDSVSFGETSFFADKYLYISEMWVNVLHIVSAKDIPVALTNAMDSERQ